MNQLSHLDLLILTREMSKNLDKGVYDILCKCAVQQDLVYFVAEGGGLTLFHDAAAKSAAAKKQVRAFVTKHITPVDKAVNRHAYGQPRFAIEIAGTNLAREQYGNANLLPVKQLPLTEDSLNRQLIFISHSSKDKKLAASLGTYLNIIGYPCFVAHDSIAGGKAWQKEINNNLDAMRIFIALVTNAFQGSVYCHQECGYAMARAGNADSGHESVKILPLLFGKNHPQAMLLGKQGIKVGAAQIHGAALAKIIQAVQPQHDY